MYAQNVALGLYSPCNFPRKLLRIRTPVAKRKTTRDRSDRGKDTGATPVAKGCRSAATDDGPGRYSHMACSSLLDSWVRRSLDAVFPPTCAACDTRVASLQTFCEPCAPSETHSPAASELQRPLSGAKSCRCVGLYAPPLSTAIKKLKFKDRPDLARLLAHHGLAQWRALLARLDACPVVIPVPLHPVRLAERGYNAPALIARELIANSHGKLDTLTLRRTRARPAQSQMASVAERRANVHRDFACRPRAAMAGPIVLVDDVITSGSTALACLRALHGAGLDDVHVFALASAAQQSTPSAPL